MKYLVVSLFTFFISFAARAVLPAECGGTLNPLTSQIQPFSQLVEGVREGKTQWLSCVPQASKTVTAEQSNQLMFSLAHALLLSPAETVEAMRRVDEIINKKGHSPVTDKLGTDAVCAYMINPQRFNRASFFSYYTSVAEKLRSLKNAGQRCLSIMQASVEETLYEEKQGRMQWGNQDYRF